MSDQRTYRHARCDIRKDGQQWAIEGHGQTRRAPCIQEAKRIAESLRDDPGGVCGKGSMLRYYLDDDDVGARGVIGVEDYSGKAFAKIAWGEGSPIGYVAAEKMAQQLAALV